MSQLFGDRAMIANATGCSSIYGGNLPTTPWTHRTSDGRGPAWCNSLFEDNAEFGLGMRLAVDQQDDYARELLRRTGCRRSATTWSTALLDADADRRGRDRGPARRGSRRLKQRLRADDSARGRELLLAVADALVRRSVWIVGGDGWAYDIGFGGLDHVLASGRDVNILVLDTEVYSNTGGQASKATPRARGGQVRLRRQGDRQEGPGHDRRRLRQRLRRPGRHGRQPAPDAQGVPARPSRTPGRR